MSGTLYPDAEYARSLAGAPNPDALVLQTSISSAISDAIDSNLFSCIVSVNGFDVGDIQATMGQLQALGYTVELTNEGD